MAAWLLSSGVAMCVDRAGLLRDAAKRIVMAAWMLHGLCFGEEAGARNVVFYRVKWLQPAMKGTSCVRRSRLRSFWFLLCVLQRVVVPVCVVLCVSWICGCRSQWNGCMNVAWAMFWGGSRSAKRCVLPCKVAAAGDERYLVCAAVAAAVVLVPPLCSATSGCYCVRSSMRFLNLWLRIALEWLHECWARLWCAGYILFDHRQW